VPPLKKEVKDLLEKQRFTEVVRLPHSPHRIFNALISLTYDKTLDIAWRAMEAAGLLSKEIAASDTETVRNIVGRLLWMIRDESGGIGWSVPETLGEIVRNNPVLCADIAPIIASFHEEKMLTSGVLRAMGRIGKINNDTVGYAIPIIITYINSENTYLRGHAAYALGEMGAIGTVSKLESMVNDDQRINFYEDGELREKTIGEIASQALEALADSAA
jgi:HEAT repeat protein